jgi:hypothetical protein
MMETKVGNLKFRVIQLDGSGLYITLQEVKFPLKLWVNFFITNKDLKNLYPFSYEGSPIFLSRGLVAVNFHRVMKRTNDFVSGIN